MLQPHRLNPQRGPRISKPRCVCGRWTLLVIRDLAEEVIGCSTGAVAERRPRTLSLRLQTLRERRRHRRGHPPRSTARRVRVGGGALMPLIEDIAGLGRNRCNSGAAAAHLPLQVSHSFSALIPARAPARSGRDGASKGGERSVTMATPRWLNRSIRTSHPPIGRSRRLRRTSAGRIRSISCRTSAWRGSSSGCASPATAAWCASLRGVYAVGRALLAREARWIDHARLWPHHPLTAPRRDFGPARRLPLAIPWSACRSRRTTPAGAGARDHRPDQRHRRRASSPRSPDLLDLADPARARVWKAFEQQIDDSPGTKQLGIVLARATGRPGRAPPRLPPLVPRPTSKQLKSN